MESPILKRIAEFLQGQKKHKQWRVVFVIMAVIVGVGTVTALRMMGLAMTHKERVLNCQLQVHKHDETCYDSDKNLICGYADYVVHKHNDDCYNADLKLVCKLPEIEKHEHTKECYNKTVTLVCGQEETAGHEHTDQCYTTQKGGLECKEKEHSHSDDCYDEEGNLTCGLDEHQHDDNCYKWEEVLTCGMKEGEGGHTHSDECYVEQEGLTCGQLELHTHTDKCFEKIDKNGENVPENLRLVCDKIQLEEHIHTEAAGCLETVEVTPGETSEEPETSDGTDGTSEEGGEIFSTNLDEEGTEGEDGKAPEDGALEGEGGEAAEGEDGSEAGEDAGEEGEEGEAGAETDATEEVQTKPGDYDETKTYEGLGYIVSASYNKEANIPEEAKLVAEQITEVTDSEDYKKHEAEFKKNMGDENATMSALFKIGFYVDNEEVEPASPVLVTIQFIDKNGLPEGEPIKVVHFGDEKTEVIDGGKAESGSTSFKTNGFSKFAVGFSKKDETDAEKTSVHIAETEIYEDDVFRATFHIEGDIEVDKEAAKDIQPDEEEKAEKESGEEKTASEDNAESAEDTEEAAESEEDTGEVAEKSEEVSAGEENSIEDTSVSDVAEPEADKDEKLKFEIKAVNEGSDKYETAVEQAGGSDEMGAMLRLQVLSCSLTYDGEEIDISDCKVTAEITTSDTLNEQAKESIPDTVKQLLGDEEKIAEVGEEIIDNGTEISVKAMGVNGAKVNTLGQTYLNEKKAEEPIVCEFDAVEEEVVLTARSQANPHFTVEYYANLKVMAKTGDADKSFDIIDTSKSGNKKDKPVLPKNGSDPVVKQMFADADGNIQYTEEQVEIYRSREFDYVMAPSLMYFDALVENKDSYKLVGIEVTTKDEAGKEKTTKYEGEQLNKLHFTNRPKTAENLEYALIDEGTVIRLIYDVIDTEWDSDVVFYDYDVSDGNIYSSANKAGGTIDRSDSNSKDKTWYIYTEQSGINSPTNYSGGGDKLAFGNSEGVLPTTLGGVQHNNYNINAATGNRGGCSYGIVTGLQDGKLVYADGITAPNLFNEGDAAGKTTYNDYDLRFVRNGDTYTLTSVTGTGANNLHKFGNKRPNYNNTRTIRSNEFWPLDNAQNAGKDGYDPLFRYDNGKLKAFSSSNTKNTPTNDFEADHNPYFGMMYEVAFDLSTDYIGPLEYYFFGDDDMWVFLDGQLVCDIGGVHSSVGEYVNLWDYLEAERTANENHVHGKECYDEKGKLTCSTRHVLSFFYTERGASGSTCWMQFTLPSISSMTPQQASGQFTNSLQVGKTIENANPDQSFEFKIHFEDSNGARLPDDYCYTKFRKKRKLDSDGNPAFDADGKPIYVKKLDDDGNPMLDADGNPVYEAEVISNDIIISDGDSFWLGDGEYIIVNYLPQGTTYTVTEVRPEDGKDDYDINIDGEEENSGVITDEMGKVDTTVEYVNEYHQYELPKTGGSGMMIYTIAGVLCILLGAGFMYTKKARERRV